MKNFIKCAKKAIICVVMAFVIFFNSVTPAHAVDPATIATAVTIVGGLVDLIKNASTVAEKDEVVEILEQLWRSYPNSTSYIELTADELQSLYVQLNGMGFPCRITSRYIAGSWCFCIEGTGYVEILPDKYFWLHSYESSNIFGDVYTNPDGWAYVSNIPMTSNDYIHYIYNEFGSVLQSINDHLDNIYYRVTKFYDYITGSPNGESPGVSLYNKLDQVINAINGISVSGGSLDVTPIVDKLQATIDAADERLTLLLSDLGGHVSTIVQEMTANTESIVDAIPDPVDLRPVNDRIDAVVDEVQKISTFADLHEIVTVTPGVLGDVHVVTTGGWNYDYLSFSYEYVEPEFIPSTDTEYIAGGWFIDYDSGTGSYIYELQDRNYYGANAVRFSAAEGYWVPSGASPAYVEVYYRDGSSLVLNVGDLTGYTPYTVSLDEVSYARVYIESGGDRWLEETGGRDLVGITYGNYDYPSTDHLSFTVDGAPHTLYFTNEYEFNSCSYGDFIWYDEFQGMWYLENLYGSGDSIPLTYYNAYLTDALTSAPTTTTTIEGETYTWFEWFYTSFKGSGGSLDVTPIVNKLKDIENALADMGSNIDIENNTNININEENENYNIFYVDDPDGGEDKSIVDLSGDTLKVFGKLLDFLYKVGFKGALDDAGGGIGDLSDFYLDTSEGSADLWVS